MEKNEKIKIELLAPARNYECGIAAIRCGADAVYIGAPKYGARKAVGNPIQDIERLVHEAHKYWAKVYVTINTILFDHEVQEVSNLINDLYNCGVDGIIIQDVGILELQLPPITLIASTQMHNYDVESIQFLESLGFRRIILARELSLEQIRTIRQCTTIELEFFIHGALCVSFSGRCYLSYATQKRSANRGECAQPCRLPYSLYYPDGTPIAQNQYLLSLKDLNLSKHLENLLDAGITSLKIEGRLKDKEYVMNVTAFYRQQLDNLFTRHQRYQRASSGTSIIDFIPDPSKTFNRGFTTYFISGRKHDILSPYTPKSLGTYLGVVDTVDNTTITLTRNVLVQAGDGICFFDTSNVLQGTRVQKVIGRKIVLAENRGIYPGIELYRNFDALFSKILNRSRTKRIVNVVLELRETTDGFELHALDEDGIMAITAWKDTANVADQPDRAIETIRKQLMKSGGTMFSVVEVRLSTRQQYFFSYGFINEKRRIVLKQLENERLKRYSQIGGRKIPKSGYKLNLYKKIDYSFNVANALAERFYKKCGAITIEPALECTDHCVGKVVMITKHCLRYYFEICKGKEGINDPLLLLDSQYEYELSFDCSACIMKITFKGKQRENSLCTRRESNPQPTAP